jgi:hypothetical protein
MDIYIYIYIYNPLGRTRRRWEDNNRMDIGMWGYGLDWLRIDTGGGQLCYLE